MSTAEFDVLIIGAGVSGIGMACTLVTECPGKTFAILERRQHLGGTWDLFRYPGVRSDSDMATYGYPFRPWTGFEMLSGGPAIRDYLADTARAYGIDAHIQHGLKITRAEWSSPEQCWTLTALAEADGATRTFRCRQLVMSTGYYSYDAGHTPRFPDIDRFDGIVVHPQLWPQTLDYRGQRVVVIGSGATAMTLVPALAHEAAHVTMLQRSPTYVLSLPSADGVTRWLSRILPASWAFGLARRRNVRLARWLYLASRRWPRVTRKLLLSQVRRQLQGAADMRDFTPTYAPWDQRLCVVPDGDLFAAIRSGKASVTTDQISGFAGRTVVLRSGRTLEADILVTATGLRLQAFGGMAISVDDEPYAPQQHMLYKGVLMEDLPNFAWIFGYTNASWTLKVEIAARYVCRLIKHLDQHGLGAATPRDTEGCQLDEPFLGSLTSGYIARANAGLPRQGSKSPWRVTHDYPSDKRVLLQHPIDDGVLAFEPLAHEEMALLATCDSASDRLTA
jgi:cation diffusion facilitator CzcD-associated flavoprotein CzcO